MVKNHIFSPRKAHKLCTVPQWCIKFIEIHETSGGTAWENKQ